MVELAQIYVGRGLDPILATQVAKQLTAHDAIESHARDELGITAALSARPVQAALASAAAFAIGAALPLISVVAVSTKYLITSVSVTSLLFLAILGTLAARFGGANIWKGAWRVVFWGVLAMAITAAIGTTFETIGANF